MSVVVRHCYLQGVKTEFDQTCFSEVAKDYYRDYKNYDIIIYMHF